MQRILFSCLILCALASCKKEVTDPTEIDLGYSYFPNKLGSYIVYQVDSIGYGITVDEAHYQIKELLAEEFIDGTNQLAMRVERYKRVNDSQPWTLSDTWVQKRTSTAVVRTEENISYVRLAFPISVGLTWNGNAYNTMDPWDYEITALDAPKTIGDFTMPLTLTVQQRNNVNLVDQEVASEVYAKDIGLVYKRLVDLEYQLGEITGIDLEMTVLDYGQEE